MANIPLSIARYVRESPVVRALRSNRPQGATQQSAGPARPQDVSGEQRLTGTAKRFEEYLHDPLVKESGQSNVDGLLTSRGEARTKQSALAQASGQGAVLENKSLSLLAALGAADSHKQFPSPRPPLSVKEPARASAPQASSPPPPAVAKPAPYKDDPSVRKAAQEFQRRMIHLNTDAERSARKVLTQQAKKALLPSGKLSAVFESGREGIGAIGYDRNGGTSYGKYQIASRTGSMRQFLGYLDAKAPQWAARLRKAGPANTGGSGGRMPRVWKAIAKEDPKRFEKLQDTFILQSHYEPALKNILAQNNVNLDAMAPAVREVLLSTAVQHGPRGAAEIFSEAMRHAGGSKGQNFDEKLIKEIYAARFSDFPSSSKRVRQAVRARLQREQALALTLLGEGDIKNIL